MIDQKDRHAVRIVGAQDRETFEVGAERIGMLRKTGAVSTFSTIEA